jgi:starch synthase (maltosyl-transferring)
MKKGQTGPRAERKQVKARAAVRLAPPPGDPITAAIEKPGRDDALARLAAQRIAIEGVSPEIDAGRFPAKAAVGEAFVVEADIFGDGHEKIDAAFLIRRADDPEWREVPMSFFDNDRWRGVITVEDNARYRYTLIAWRDLFASWRDGAAKKHAAGVAVALEMSEGRDLVETTLRDGDR